MTIPEHKRRCQLCLSEYNTVRKWPSETISDIEDKGIWSLLSRHFVCNSIVFVTHYAICTEYLLTPINQDTHRNVVVYELTQPHGTYCFLVLLSILTSMYVVFFRTYAASVKNKLRYILYWFRGDITHYTNVSPRMYMAYILSSLAAIWYSTFLFGIIYIFLLPKWIQVHNGILHAINYDGEIDE